MDTARVSSAAVAAEYAENPAAGPLADAARPNAAVASAHAEPVSKVDPYESSAFWAAAMAAVTPAGAGSSLATTSRRAATVATMRSSTGARYAAPTRSLALNEIWSRWMPTYPQVTVPSGMSSTTAT